ncbi:hypothetical protein BD770DRAFT_404258 [Pilaira anomala]|nr:hypothetical protein BD770DRAFT_404258 [Pilaira anomala]
MMMPLGIIPSGPKKTYDLMPFLKPFIDEINELSTKGMRVEKNGEVVYVGKVFILGITGDIPGIASLIYHQGHQAVYESKGMKGTHQLIASLPTFFNTVFFFADEFHLHKNISQLCYDLILPSKNLRFKCINSTDYSFDLNVSSRFFEKIDTYVKDSRQTIPTSFEGNWQRTKGHNRAVDWLDFLLYILPTIVIEHLKHKRTKYALMNLVYVVRLLYNGQFPNLM